MKFVCAAILLTAALNTACSREDTAHARSQARDAGNEMKRDLKKAGTEIKHDLHEAGQELKKDANGIKRDVNEKKR